MNFVQIFRQQNKAGDVFIYAPVKITANFEKNFLTDFN